MLPATGLVSWPCGSPTPGPAGRASASCRCPGVGRGGLLPLAVGGGRLLAGAGLGEAAVGLDPVERRAQAVGARRILRRPPRRVGRRVLGIGAGLAAGLQGGVEGGGAVPLLRLRVFERGHRGVEPGAQPRHFRLLGPQLGGILGDRVGDAGEHDRAAHCVLGRHRHGEQGLGRVERHPFDHRQHGAELGGAGG